MTVRVLERGDAGSLRAVRLSLERTGRRHSCTGATSLSDHLFEIPFLDGNHAMGEAIANNPVGVDWNFADLGDFNANVDTQTSLSGGSATC
jgi:hypothetical protein